MPVNTKKRRYKTKTKGGNVRGRSKTRNIKQKRDRYYRNNENEQGTKREVDGYTVFNREDFSSPKQNEQLRRREVNGYTIMDSDDFNSPNQNKIGF